MPSERQDGSAGRGTPAATGSSPRGRILSVLDVVRLSPDPVFPPGGEALFRQIAILSELRAGQEILDAACGRGLTTAFLAAQYGAHGTGLDPDPLLIAEAEQRGRTLGLEKQLTFEAAPLDDLPFQDDVFDLTIGEVGLAASFSPAAVIRELARVTRPMGTVALVQLVWTGNIEEDRREVLVQHLGARPMLLVEWKQLLRDAGCVDLHVEDWSDYAAPFRPAVAGPFHDIAELFSLRQKVAILRRAFTRWGWRGVRGAIVREQEIHELLTRHRVLGLNLILGRKWRPADSAGGAGG
jgi:SAM-dependent methyltransferase